MFMYCLIFDTKIEIEKNGNVLYWNYQENLKYWVVQHNLVKTKDKYLDKISGPLYLIITNWK